MWQWPCELRSGEVTPDTRLLCPEVAGLTARLCFSDETVQVCDVRSVSDHDVVLKVADLSRIPIKGQIVEVTISDGDRMVLDSQKSVLHWAGEVSKRGIIALFTINSVGNCLGPYFHEDARGEIRFPVELQAMVELQDGREVNGRIVEYSLSGCRFVCEEPLALDCEYHMTVKTAGSSVDLALRPRWSSKSESGYQMGCTFRSEEGVLLACRHHTEASKAQSGMRPTLNGWRSRSHG